MNIRKAEIKDISKICNLLGQVLMVHHNVRPDIFKANEQKYNFDEVKQILNDETKNIFVATNENDEVLGYVFCIFKVPTGSHIFQNVKTLYIDDLCVDEQCRGQHIGKELYNYAVNFAKENGCYNVCLNVWYDNTKALEFYKKLGLKPQKVGMEIIL